MDAIDTAGEDLPCIRLLVDVIKDVADDDSIDEVELALPTLSVDLESEDDEIGKVAGELIILVSDVPAKVLV